MEIVKQGFFRVAVAMTWTASSNPHILHDEICKVLEPYNLTVWDNASFPTQMKYETGQDNRGCFDIHVENELFGDQPVRNLMDAVSAIPGVLGVVFIDTSSIYCIPIFYTNSQTPPEIFKAIKSSFIEETLSNYEHEKNRINA